MVTSQMPGVICLVLYILVSRTVALNLESPKSGILKRIRQSESAAAIPSIISNSSDSSTRPTFPRPVLDSTGSSVPSHVSTTLGSSSSLSFSWLTSSITSSFESSSSVSSYGYSNTFSSSQGWPFSYDSSVVVSAGTEASISPGFSPTNARSSSGATSGAVGSGTPSTPDPTHLSRTFSLSQSPSSSGQTATSGAKEPDQTRSGLAITHTHASRYLGSYTYSETASGSLHGRLGRVVNRTSTVSQSNDTEANLELSRDAALPTANEVRLGSPASHPGSEDGTPNKDYYGVNADFGSSRNSTNSTVFTIDASSNSTTSAANARLSTDLLPPLHGTEYDTTTGSQPQVMHPVGAAGNASEGLSRLTGAVRKSENSTTATRNGTDIASDSDCQGQSRPGSVGGKWNVCGTSNTTLYTNVTKEARLGSVISGNGTGNLPIPYRSGMFAKQLASEGHIDPNDIRPEGCNGTITLRDPGARTRIVTSTITVDIVASHHEPVSISEIPTTSTPPPACVTVYLFGYIMFIEPMTSTLLVTKKNTLFVGEGDAVTNGQLFAGAAAEATPANGNKNFEPKMRVANSTPGVGNDKRPVEIHPNSESVGSPNDAKPVFDKPAESPASNGGDHPTKTSGSGPNPEDSGDQLDNSANPDSDQNSAGKTTPVERINGQEFTNKYFGQQHSEEQTDGKVSSGDKSIESQQSADHGDSRNDPQASRNRSDGASETGGTMHQAPENAPQQDPSSKQTEGQNFASNFFGNEPEGDASGNAIASNGQTSAGESSENSSSRAGLSGQQPDTGDRFQAGQPAAGPGRGSMVGDTAAERSASKVFGQHAASQEQSNSLTKTQAKAPVIHAGGEAFTVHEADLETGDRTIPRPRGPEPSPFVLNDKKFSLSPSQIISPDQKISLPPADKPRVFVYDGQTLSADKSHLFDGSTSVPLSPNGVADYNGQKLRIGPSEVIGPSATISLAPTLEADLNTHPKAITTGGHVITVGLSAAVIGSSTYSFIPGKAPELFEDRGEMIMVGPEGIKFGNVVIPVPTNIPSYSVIRQGSLTISVAPSEAVVGGIHVKNVQPGMAPITTTIGGQSVNIGANGVELAGTTIAYPIPKPSYSVTTAGRLKFSLAPSEAIIQGSTFHISPNSPTRTKVFDGETVKIGPSGIEIKGSTVDLPNVSAPAKVAAHGLDFSVGATAAVIGGSTYAIGSGAVENTVTVGSEIIEIGTKGVVLPPQTLGMGVVLPGTTIMPDQTPTPTILGGISLAADASEAVLNGTTYAIGSGAKATTLIVGSQTVRLDSNGIILPFTTLRPWLSGGSSGFATSTGSMPGADITTPPQPPAPAVTAASGAESRDRSPLRGPLELFSSAFLASLFLLWDDELWM